MTLPLRKQKNQNGQALLILLLVLSVVLSIVLSIASRSITEVTVTRFEEDSARALSAAEAGVEDVLIKGVAPSSPVDLGSNVAYDTSVTILTPSTGEFVYPDRLDSGESVTFWFVGHDNNGNLVCSSGDCYNGDDIKLCWGDSNSPSEPAIELIFYYNTTWATDLHFGNTNVTRRAYDPSTSRSPDSNFLSTTGTCTVDGTEFLYSTPTLDPSDELPCNPSSNAGCLLMIRARMFYNEDVGQQIGIIASGGSGGLPAQGALIDSVGTANEATRRIHVFRAYPSPPDVFDSAVFSYTDLVK
jgi:hypothetical protein